MEWKTAIASYFLLSVVLTSKVRFWLYDMKVKELMMKLDVRFSPQDSEKLIRRLIYS